jgi:hypothetical protein
MNEKKNPLLPMIVINRFLKSCGTLRGGEEKTQCHQQHWVNLFRKLYLIFFLKQQ